MFLTSVIATFLAGLSLGGSIVPGLSVDTETGFGRVSFLVTPTILSRTGGVNINYTYTNSDTEEGYTTNVGHFKLNNNGVLYYGFEGVENNSFYNIVVIEPNSSTYLYGDTTVYEWFDNTLTYSLDISSIISSPSTPIVIRCYYGLLTESVYESSINNDSYQKGFIEGYDAGYDDGENYGNITGYGQGYSDAREDYEDQSATVNSIFSGILSIGLIPLEFFMSIFNFSILGINITSIISAILSLMIIVILLRIVLGGKSGKE